MQNLARQGKPATLADALTEQGYITKTQLERMKSAIDEARPAHRIPGYQILEKLGKPIDSGVLILHNLSNHRVFFFLPAKLPFPHRLPREWPGRFFAAPGNPR